MPEHIDSSAKHKGVVTLKGVVMHYKWFSTRILPLHELPHTSMAFHAHHDNGQSGHHAPRRHHLRDALNKFEVVIIAMDQCYHHLCQRAVGSVIPLFHPHLLGLFSPPHQHTKHHHSRCIDCVRRNQHNNKDCCYCCYYYATHCTPFLSDYWHCCCC